MAADAIVLALSMTIGASIGTTAAAPSQSQHATSVAAFRKVARVLQHPRCQNCHPVTDYPTQGDDLHPHRIHVLRGPADRGIAALRCTTCHGDANNSNSGVPGAPDWHLAPRSMGWQGLSLGQLCRHLLDPARNGGRSGAQVIEHLSTPLVEWAWAPGQTQQGRERSSPPISHAEFVSAAQRWITAGASCPDE